MTGVPCVSDEKKKVNRFSFPTKQTWWLWVIWSGKTNNELDRMFHSLFPFIHECFHVAQQCVRVGAAERSKSVTPGALFPSVVCST